LFNFALGLVVAFYILLNKEAFMRMILKGMKAFLRRRTFDYMVSLAQRSHNKVERFFVGKFIESLLVGIIFFVIAMVIGLPYIMLLTLIVMVTNMIPYFGPIVGGIICTLIVFVSTIYMDSGITLTLATGITILIIQQIDGIILAPKILGDSVGVGALSVLFAIFVGGALFGVAGMFFGVPAFAVLRDIISDIIDRKYRRKTGNTGDAESNDI
jgi:predicted PurR-regulated permease PerM